jgi:hypothetical protein
LEGSNRIGFAGVGWAPLSRSRLAGLKASLTPTVWEAFQRGDLDAEQVRVIDRVARRATEPQTLVSIDEKVIDAAQTKCEILRDQIAEALNFHGRDEVLFARLLTDKGGRLLDTTELGRYPSARLAQAIMIRAGTCRFPTCTVPADRCDIDHHEPAPRGATSASNLDPFLAP